MHAWRNSGKKDNLQIGFLVIKDGYIRSKIHHSSKSYLSFWANGWHFRYESKCYLAN